MKRPISYDVLLRVDAVCERFEDLARCGRQPRIEAFLDGWEGELRETLFCHLAEIEIEYGRRTDRVDIPSNLAKRFPEYTPAILAIGEPEDDRTWAPSGPTAAVEAGEFPSRVGDYRIVREVGRGGMGVVYEAQQQSLDRRVALKVLPFHVSRDSLALDRFHREAQFAAKLHHTNIVPVYEVGQDGDTCYYAMQFIEGHSLDDLRRTAASDGKSDAVRFDYIAPGGLSRSSGSGTTKRYDYYRSLAHIGERVADALQYAHSHGVIHRDIKPANLLLDGAGVVWITDFGLAKGEGIELTQSGDLLGTLRYVSPERLQGQCDARADIYGLGVTLYELLTRRPLFDMTNRLELLRVIADEEPPRPRSIDARVPRDLETIVLKALRKAPQDRYASARQMAEDLRRFANDEPIVARRLWPWERFRRWCRRNPIVAALTVAVAALLLATTAISFRAAVVQDRLATDADVQKRSAEDRLIDVHTANGQRLVEQDRLPAALPWLAEAMRLDRRRALQLGAASDPIHRIRFATALRPCPKFSQAWCNTEGFNHARFSPDNSLVALACADNAARLFDTATGAAVGQVLHHEAEVVCVAFSADGRYLATGCRDGTVGLWDANSGERVAVPYAHQSNVVAICVSSDGSIVGSASEDGTARIWHVWGHRQGEFPSNSPLPSANRDAHDSANDASDNYHALRTGWSVRLEHGRQVRSVQFSQDESQLLTASHDGYARLWDVDSGIETLRIEHEAGVEFASFAANDERILTASRTRTGQGTGHVWDLEGKPVLPPLRHDSVVKHIAISPDGTTIATASEDRTARLWDAQTGQSKEFVLRHRGVVNLVRFSPDGRFVLTASDDFSLVVWDVSTGQPAMPALPHNGEVISAEFSNDGSQILTACYGRVAYLWELGSTDSTKTSLRHDGDVTHAEFDRTGNHILTASLDRSVCVWDAWTMELTLPSLEHQFPVQHAALSADGSRIATASGSREGGEKHGELRLWNATDGRLIWTLEFDDVVEFCRFSPDGSRITCIAGKRAMLVDPTRREITATFGHDDRVSSAAFSPDGSQLVTTSFDTTARVWNTATGSPAFPPLVHAARVDFACYSPSGDSFVTTSSGEGERSVSILWNATTGGPITTFSNHRSWYVLHAAFHPSGKYVCSAGSVAAIQWDVATGVESASALRHQGMVQQVKFSPDGRLVATASWDHTARVWDAMTGQPVSPPIQHSDWVTSVSFSPDSLRLVTASRDGTSRIVDLRPIDGAEGDLVRISELLSAERIDQNGGTARLSVDRFEANWRAVRGKLRSLIH